MTQGSSGTTTPGVASAAGRRAAGLLTALRLTAGLELLSILVQATTAGGRIAGSGLGDLHGPGSTAVHLFGLILVVVSLLWWRNSKAHGWTVLLSLVVFVGGIVQSMLGGLGFPTAHVPVGVTLAVLTALLVVAPSRTFPTTIGMS